MIDQVSIYLENERGMVLRVLSLLAKSEINVLGLVSKDNTEFGTLRLTLSDAAFGMKVLQEAGYVCRKGSVLDVELDDTQTGSLERMFERIEFMNVDIDYPYVGYAREDSAPIIMVHCDFMETVQDNLSKACYMI